VVADAVEGLRFGQDFSGETQTVGEDAESSIEAFVDLDARMSVALAVTSSRDVDDVRPEAYGVVVAHHASVFETEELIQSPVLGPRYPGRLGVLSGDHESSVVTGKAALKDLVGVVRSTGTGKAKLADEAVLEGAPQPFHATLRLR